MTAAEFKLLEPVTSDEAETLYPGSVSERRTWWATFLPNIKKEYAVDDDGYLYVQISGHIHSWDSEEGHWGRLKLASSA